MRTPDPTLRFDSLQQGLEAAGFVILDVISNGDQTDMAIGSAGRPFWDAVSQSREWIEQHDNPIDQYTARLINQLLRADQGESAIYPFDSDAPNFVQLWPATFPKIAASQLGPMIHPDFGLWMAARAHIILPQACLTFDDTKSFSPCESCRDKPCLSACPVNAFSASKPYNHLACAAYLKTDPACFSGGCDARAACPHGQSWQLPEDQARYHQTRFRTTFA
ncbi:MAG: hypothetical protein CME01_05745 [Geminicoccus sp.]|nr:hypothetical protein [Geminicoccus sp.]